MEDKLLIWKFKRGSREALRRIYDKYHGKLLKLAIVLTGNPDEAEDIVQEVFTHFAQSANRFGLSGSLKSYLITSTLNCIRNQRRDNRRRTLQSLDKAENIPSMARRPDQWAVLSERLEHLSRAMVCLPYEQREVITLRMEAKMTFRQIAGVLCEGLETTDPTFGVSNFQVDSVLARIWVSLETGYPVMLEAEITGGGDEKLHITGVLDQFQWDVVLDPSIFEPNIPQDYEMLQ